MFFAAAQYLNYTFKMLKAKYIQLFGTSPVLRVVFITILCIGFTPHGAFAKSKNAKTQKSSQKILQYNSLDQVPEHYRALNQRLIDILKKSGVPASEVGMWVGLQTDQGVDTILNLSSEKSMVPASLSKLITLGAVLKTLGPTFKFQTQLVTSAKIQDQVLKGDLILKGGGDPSFVSEDMWALVNDFTRNQITQIDGDILVDDSRFDKVRFGDDRESTRVDRAYDAPVGAMSMNWNSVNVYVRPGKKSGDPAQVFADPASSYIRVENQASTGGKAKSIVVERISRSDFRGDVIRVSGKIPEASDEIVIYKSVTQPEIWSGYHLLEFLKQRGIKVKGQIKIGTASKDAKILANRDSKEVARIVADMAKFSNNYVAEMLAKNLAAESGETPATMKTAIAIINKFMKEIGAGGESLRFINASGFTRENKISPLELGKYLQIMQSDFAIFPEYVSALPIAGLDGTLKKRMKNLPHFGWVRAKTGLLNGTVGLAGFVGMDHGHSAVFAFIYNGGSGAEEKARNLFDKIAEELAQ